MIGDSDPICATFKPARITHVYVAGPFTGKGETVAERYVSTRSNIRRATALGVQVAKLGAHPIIPHANCGDDRFWDPDSGDFCGQNYDWWIKATGELLLRCDAVLFTTDWQESSGARGEERLAAEHGVPRFYSLSDLACWLLPGLAEATNSVRPVLDESAETQPEGLAACSERDTEHPYGVTESGGIVTLSELAKALPIEVLDSSLADPRPEDFEPPTCVECPHPQIIPGKP